MFLGSGLVGGRYENSTHATIAFSECQDSYRVNLWVHASEDLYGHVKQNAYIRLHSTRIVQTALDTWTATLPSAAFRWVLMAKQYGMNSGTPFLKVADRVDITATRKAAPPSGRPITFR